MNDYKSVEEQLAEMHNPPKVNLNRPNLTKISQLEKENNHYQKVNGGMIKPKK